MSHESNVVFLEEARENFIESLNLDTAEGFEQCEAIIKDVRDVSPRDADFMQTEYDEAYELFIRASKQADKDNFAYDEARDIESSYEPVNG